MRKLLLVLFIVVSTISCSINKKTVFTAFNNDISIKTKAADELISDKDFNITIPNTLKSSRKVISEYFLNELIFDDQQRLMTFYLPKGKTLKSIDKTDLDYKEFKRVIEEIDLCFVVKDIKLKTKRRYALVVKDDNYVLMYLNIKNHNVKHYDYSLNTFKVNR